MLTPNGIHLFRTKTINMLKLSVAKEGRRTLIFYLCLFVFKCLAFIKISHEPLNKF